MNARAGSGPREADLLIRPVSSNAQQPRLPPVATPIMPVKLL
jgi:hypothetical protein